MPLQTWIHNLEEGAGARAMRVAAALLAFLALAGLFDLLCAQYFTSEEAMETAQLARNLSQGRGYTTDSIRPLALYLLANTAEPGQSSKVLAQPVPDLSNAPVWPFLLAGLMKVLPFNFAAKQWWSYPPELWIAVFNQVLFFAAMMLLFALARNLFDAQVAWLSAALFAGRKLFWRFSVSGLSTIWLMLLLLVVVWLMVEIARREREGGKGSLLLAAGLGALVGVGGLSRYPFGLMILPVILFVAMGETQIRAKLCATMAVAFLVVMTPWVVRNFVVSGHCFGTGAYALAQGTERFPGDTMERSTNPTGGLTRVGPANVIDKFTANARDICAHDLARLGGNWISAFFLVGLWVPFRNPNLSRLRWFVVGSLLVLFVTQALVQTHVTTDSPEINSENLMVLLSPLIFMFGAALFHTLLDQLNLAPTEGRNAVVSIFVAVLSAPFLFSLVSARPMAANSPYSPLHIQRIAQLMQTNELMTSDIPGGVAWYGGRSCVWLPLDDDREFFKVNALKPIRGLFLTQATTGRPFLDTVADETSWGHFLLECSEHGEVPPGFPLRKAPAPRGYLPEQLFLSDKIRWQPAKKPDKINQT